MRVVQTPIPDILILEPDVFKDERGFFLESFNEKNFKEETGQDVTFVQDNHSRSKKNVLRGLHYQIKHPQGKLVHVVNGVVFDVVVDIRKSSPTFGQWTGVELSEENHRHLWIPEGFAHGFVVLSDFADFLYKTTDYYVPDSERCILWNDPSIDINWNLDDIPNLSEKDMKGMLLDQAELYP